MISLIDADSIVYIVAWNHKEGATELELQMSTDSVVTMILHNTLADEYLGVLSDTKNFRHLDYRYAPYKGNRPPKEDWFKEFESIIKLRLADKWKFYMATDLEADDVICTAAEYCQLHYFPYTICSPDKDLRQIQGKHYDYKKNEFVEVKEDEAFFNLCMQILTGDKVDNIAGIYGLGEVKSKKLLLSLDTPLAYFSGIKAKYIEQYGPNYGPLIYQQTLNAVRLLNSKHFFWSNYREQVVADIEDRCVKYDRSTATNFEDIKLDILGW